MWTTLLNLGKDPKGKDQVFIEFVAILLPFYILGFFFGCEESGILTPQPGIEPSFSALAGSLNHWTARGILKQF